MTSAKGWTWVPMPEGRNGVTIIVRGRRPSRETTMAVPGGTGCPDAVDTLVCTICAMR